MIDWFAAGFYATLGRVAAYVLMVLMVLGVLAFCVLAFLAYQYGWLYIRVRRCRHIKPEVGQVWIQDGDKDDQIYITKVWKNRGVTISTAEPGATRTHSSWGEKSEEFETRRRNRYLILKTPSDRTEGTT